MPAGLVRKREWYFQHTPSRGEWDELWKGMEAHKDSLVAQGHAWPQVRVVEETWPVQHVFPGDA